MTDISSFISCNTSAVPFSIIRRPSSSPLDTKVLSCTDYSQKIERTISEVVEAEGCFHVPIVHLHVPSWGCPNPLIYAVRNVKISQLR